MDALEPGGISRRKLRAVALAGAAVIVMVAGGLVYLHSSPPAAPLAVNPADATPDFAVYDFTSPTVAWALGFPDRSLGSRSHEQSMAGSIGRGDFQVTTATVSVLRF